MGKKSMPLLDMSLLVAYAYQRFPHAQFMRALELVRSWKPDSINGPQICTQMP